MGLNLSKKIVCGILNVTPDSFSDGGLYYEKEKAISRVAEMINEGANWIDIGGQSSRPYSKPLTPEIEIERIIPVIREVKKRFSVIISVDTYYPKVAEYAIKEGADIINDITGLRDAEMINIVIKYNKPIIIMHMKGMPSDMQIDPKYDDVVGEIRDFFIEKIKYLNSKNFNDIIIDPGIGFGKTVEHNIELIKNIKVFKELGYPVMIGTSRKSFIGAISGEKEPKKRLAGTISSCLFCYDYVDIFRVHDVYEMVQAIKVWEALR